MVQVKPANSTIPSSDTPSAYAIAANGWLPVIDHPNRPSFVRFERFPRKIKSTAAEATDYASRVIFYRRLRAESKYRKLEAISHPRWFELQAAE
jgi:hypothetical protein